MKEGEKKAWEFISNEGMSHWNFNRHYISYIIWRTIFYVSWMLCEGRETMSVHVIMDRCVISCAEMSEESIEIWSVWSVLDTQNKCTVIVWPLTNLYFYMIHSQTGYTTSHVCMFIYIYEQIWTLVPKWFIVLCLIKH
jgi:hypothetical protein